MVGVQGGRGAPNTHGPCNEGLKVSLRGEQAFPVRQRVWYHIDDSTPGGWSVDECAIASWDSIQTSQAARRVTQANREGRLASESTATKKRKPKASHVKPNVTCQDWRWAPNG